MGYSGEGNSIEIHGEGCSMGIQLSSNAFNWLV